ncbi:RNA polymerase sigma factor [Anatilimnocola aggregata]|uniref:RNA polymerase sigma factor n=1 Tax=Anatilimnocola aggregata TaxID=2528021 RepID=A0A517YMD1_9BACT|nr:sigma-70 family RNA polymerase sigma factor [Anatilimnocola aggregata]QDU31380.1 RNA polymerase sigma factor [Anatilimnocola aggregata]
MHSTSFTLLERVKVARNDADWDRFVNLYTPMLFAWAKRFGLGDADACDLAQDVLLILLKELPNFERGRKFSFRSWLRTIATNKCREHLRRKKPQALDPMSALQLSDFDAEPFWEHEYRQLLVARALTVMKAEFEATTWQACWEHVVSGRKAADIGAELRLSEGAVYAAKCRVMKRLREELEGLLE